MFDVKNLSIKLIKNSYEIIKNLNLSIQNNDKLAIIGEEGTGKSTLIKVLCGFDVSSYAQVSGKINITNIKIGYLSQSFSSKTLEMTINEFFMYDERLDDYDYDIFNEIKLIKKLFSDFELNTEFLDEDKKLKFMSGGERLKVAIIKLIASKPDVIILDEPTNDLDIDSLNVLENFIKEDNRPIIYVSHDEKLLENTANCILHIESVKKKTQSKWTYERLNYLNYIENRNFLLNKQDQIATFQHSKFDEKLERWRKIYNKVDNDLNSISRQDPHGGYLLKKKMKSVKAQEKKLEKERENLPEFAERTESIFLKFQSNQLDKNSTILNIDINELKAGDKILSKNINFKIKGKDKIVIIGKNGAGKTTLIKEIMSKLSETKLNVGYMPQNIDDEFTGFDDVLSYVQETAYSKEERTKIRTFLGSLKFTENEIMGRIQGLSGGSKVKLILAKLMAQGKELLVLDEPTRNLSPLSCPELRNALSLFNGAILAISHDRKFIEEVATTVYSLCDTGLVCVTDKFIVNK